MILVFQSVITQFRKLFLDKFRITKCDKVSLLQSESGITKCERLLLQSVRVITR